GEVSRRDGVACAITPTEMTIAFPRLTQATATTTLDMLVGECYRRKLKSASCWSLTPTHPRDLGAKIAARGFEWGWRPHWMALDLGNLRTDFPLPTGLRLTVDDVSEWDVGDLPYYRREEAGKLQALAQAQPRRMWHFGAWLEDKIVGHSVLYLTTGPYGVAGVYNVGVVPSARFQGIGTAISLAPCRFAQALGCHYALLNSAADSLYARIGFQSLGYGQTWWIHAPTLAAPPPTSVQIAFAEAIGRGDIAALDRLERSSLPENLDTPLPNGMTPMALAISARKAASAEWLIAHGATLDILHAWDLGWRGRARRLLAARPELANRRTGAWQITPLHEAVYRNDPTLARLLLTAKPDLEIQDTEFHSTPLGWARHFQRKEIIVLLERYQASRK
ncbi:MAG TPA: GNAT family N-acetyltransferase, partial [Chthonomonadaceae bacterium]|nr:GNAT family N-acetyltransferase [Chthonomonadaceae bacterium]